MTDSTPAVITMLHGELEKCEDKEAKIAVVMLEIRFRDNEHLMNSVIIDYEASFSRESFHNLAAADEEAGAA